MPGLRAAAIWPSFLAKGDVEIGGGFTFSFKLERPGIGLGATWLSRRFASESARNFALCTSGQAFPQALLRPCR